jgi:Fur family peroxide stress response transcriptional regulator
MKKQETPTKPPSYESVMGREGLRLTPQRRHVYEVLMEKRDHPTATEVFIRAQQGMPTISLATVYNCLETMVGSGLVKAVHVDREPTRFCANLHEHGHFHCTGCGHIADIEFSRKGASAPPFPPAPKGWKLPEGYLVTHQDLTLRGLCPDCASGKQSTTPSTH